MPERPRVGARIVRTRQVAVDVAPHPPHIAADNQAAAERLLGRIDQRVRQLAAFPETGSPRDDIRDGCRMVIVSGYRVLYEYDRPTDTVTVMTIVEPHRDLKGVL